MKLKSTLTTSALAMLSLGASAQADEMGRVVSATPVIQQVAVPRQVCGSQPMAIQQPNSGAGAVMGAIAGGAMGNAIGGGSGRAAATIIGLVGGAALGNRIEGSPSYVQNVPQCTTQTTYENRTVAYNVTYEYAGKQYTVQMPNDPGPSIRLQVTPVGAVNGANSAPPMAAYNDQPVVVSSADVQPIAVAPAATVVYPAPYYYRPYYPPIGLSLNLGYSRGWGHHGHGHWR